jgi:hypothetical protein
VTIPATVPQISETPEGLTNYRVYFKSSSSVQKCFQPQTLQNPSVLQRLIIQTYVKEMKAVCSEDLKKHLNALCRRNTEILSISEGDNWL